MTVRPQIVDHQHEQAVWADPRCLFVVTPPAGRASLSVAGRAFAFGEVIDKSLVDARRLRQMYEARVISLAPGCALPATAARPRAVGPTGPVAPPAETAAPAAPPAPHAVTRRRLVRSAA